MAIELVDMCSLQNPEGCDFNKMKDSGIRGVYLKASQYSSSIDPTYTVGLARAKAAGLVCGAYHFAFCGSDPAAQMMHFYEASGGQGCNNGELPPMIDWEFSKNDKEGKPITLTASVLWLIEAAKTARELWYPDVDRLPIIYTYPYFGHERDIPLKNYGAKLAHYPLCLADYSGSKTPQRLEPWGAPTIHQYIGNGGKVPGVSGDCDRDRFLGTEEQWRLFLGHRDEATVGSGGIIHDLHEVAE